MPFLIKHNNVSYYRAMTQIGPMFTKDIAKAKRFDVELDACRETLYHWAFDSTEVVEEKGGGKG
jgi:hypothetical protein